jgi:hypothetical protein
MKIRFHLHWSKGSHTDHYFKGMCVESFVEHRYRAVGTIKEKEEVFETRGESLFRAPFTRDKRLENTESRKNMSDGVSDNESLSYRSTVHACVYDQSNRGRKHCHDLNQLYPNSYGSYIRVLGR